MTSKSSSESSLSSSDLSLWAPYPCPSLPPLRRSPSSLLMDVQCLNWMGVCWLEQGNYLEANEAFREAIDDLSWMVMLPEPIHNRNHTSHTATTNTTSGFVFSAQPPQDDCCVLQLTHDPNQVSRPFTFDMDYDENNTATAPEITAILHCMVAICSWYNLGFCLHMEWAALHRYQPQPQGRPRAQQRQGDAASESLTSLLLHQQHQHQQPEAHEQEGGPLPQQSVASGPIYILQDDFLQEDTTLLLQALQAYEQAFSAIENIFQVPQHRHLILEVLMHLCINAAHGHSHLGHISHVRLWTARLKTVVADLSQLVAPDSYNDNNSSYYQNGDDDDEDDEDLEDEQDVARKAAAMVSEEEEEEGDDVEHHDSELLDDGDMIMARRRVTKQHQGQQSQVSVTAAYAYVDEIDPFLFTELMNQDDLIALHSLIYSFLIHVSIMHHTRRSFCLMVAAAA